MLGDQALDDVDRKWPHLWVKPRAVQQPLDAALLVVVFGDLELKAVQTACQAHDRRFEGAPPMLNPPSVQPAPAAA